MDQAQTASPSCLLHDQNAGSSTRFSSSVVSKLRTLSTRTFNSDAPDVWVAATVLFSASTYFFDYASNIATAWKYYELEYRNRSSDVGGFRSYGPESEFPGIFPGIVAIMVLAHVVSALVFHLHFGSSSEALKCAYLLPIIYLKKLLLLVWRTGTFQGLRDLRSPEVDSVYNILAAALETGPQLILQFHVFVELGYLTAPGTKPPSVLVLSIAASFVSGAYNGGLAMATTCDKSTLFARTAMGTAGGLHIISSLLLRSLAFEVITEEGFYHHSSSFRYYHVYLCLAVFIPCLAFWVLLRPSPKQQQQQQQQSQGDEELKDLMSCNTKRVIKCLSYAYLSITLGPLYPLVSHAKETKQQHNRAFRMRIFLSSMVHLSLDVAALVLVCGIHGKEWLTPCYFGWATASERVKRAKQEKQLYPQRFISCSHFKALLAFSPAFYFVTLVWYLTLDGLNSDKGCTKSDHGEA